MTRSNFYFVTALYVAAAFAFGVFVFSGLTDQIQTDERAYQSGTYKFEATRGEGFFIVQGSSYPNIYRNGYYYSVLVSTHPDRHGWREVSVHGGR